MPTHMETAVTRLLVSTRELLEALTEWSTGHITDENVSDIYVKLGNDFNTAVAAFSAFGIQMEDLSAVPNDLRTCLESALSLDPTPDNLNLYLPSIRAIIVTLLGGLKNKQALYRSTIQRRAEGTRRMEQQALDQRGESSRSGRLNAVSPSGQPGHSRQDGWNSAPTSHYDRDSNVIPDSRAFSPGDLRDSGPTGYSESARRGSYHSIGNGAPPGPSPEPRSGRRPAPPARSVLPSRSNAHAGIPLPPAPPDAFRPHRQRSDGRGTPSPTPPKTLPAVPVNGPSQTSVSTSVTPSTPYSEPVRHKLTDPPAPSPEETTPRSQLQRPTPPPRRTPPSTSRFSLDSEIDSPRRNERGTTSTISLDTAMIPHSTSVPTLPPLAEVPTLQNPIELTSEKESAEPLQGQSAAALASLAALQNSEALNRRASKRYSQFQYKQMLPGHARAPSSSLLRTGADISPQRPMRRVSRPVPPVPPIPSVSVAPPPAEASSQAKTREDAVPHGVPEETVSQLAEASKDATSRRESTSSEVVVASPAPTTISLPVGEPTTPVPEMRVFLQYGRETKRATLDSREISSVADLKGIFMSKFDYTPDGMELFPDVYIKDPATGIAYHLEEIEDIKPDSLLSLNIDPLDQVRQHFDNTITTLSHEIKDLKNNIVSSRRLSAIVPSAHPHNGDRLSPVAAPAEHAGERQLPRLAVTPHTSPTISATTPSAPASAPRPSNATDLRSQYTEIQNLRRDLGVMRQVYVDFVAQTKSTFETLRDQTQAVREVAITKLKGSRALVDAGKAALEKHSQDTVQSVENISDIVDAVKQDVLRRQILPKQSQMASMEADLEKAKESVAKLREQLTLAAPAWKQTWNQELKQVLEEQHMLQHQEKLAKDLEGDIGEASGIFATLQEYVAQRQQGPSKGLRTYQPPAEQEQDAVPSLLMEIRTKEVDPNKRLRAIEQQQKARQREIAEKSDDFTNELSGFVSAKKLKKTGGPEEAERLRQRKQEQQLKKLFDSRDGPQSGKQRSTSEVSSAASQPSTPGPVTEQLPDKTESLAAAEPQAIDARGQDRANDKPEDDTSQQRDAVNQDEQQRPST